MTFINLGYGGFCGVSEINVNKLMLSADSLCLHLAVSATLWDALDCPCSMHSSDDGVC